MPSTVIKIENLSKYYRLGLIGGGTLREDVGRRVAKMRGQPDPLLKIGEQDHGNRKDGQIWALKDINLEVNEGEILGIIGRNGAGKSTLLKILSKITAPTEGRIKINGRIGSLLEVGTGFHPELTGRENIYLNGTILGMSHTEVASKLEEIVEFSEMGKFIDTPVKRYSSGMTVRLAFAVAAHLEPEILIIDEVLAVGDAAFQKKCIGKMKEISGHGRTVLFVSHNMTLVKSICERVALMSYGEISEIGETDKIISNYLRNSLKNRVERLTNYKKRAGNGKLRILSIRLLNTFGKETKRLMCGDSCVFVYSIKCFESLKKAKFKFTIYSSNSTPLLHFDSSVFKNETFLGVGHISLNCKIVKLPLSDGDYYINVGVEEDGMLVDVVEMAFSFSVEGGDYFKTGRSISGIREVSFTEHFWDVANNEVAI